MSDGVASVSDAVVAACIFITFVFICFIHRRDVFGDISLVVVITISRMWTMLIPCHFLDRSIIIGINSIYY